MESVNCIVKEVPHTIASFAQKCESVLNVSLGRVSATVKVVNEDTSEKSLICIIPIKVFKEPNEVRDWKEQCHTRLEQFLITVSHFTLPITPEIFPKAQEVFEENESNPSIYIEFSKDKSALQIAGYTEEARSIVNKIKYSKDSVSAPKDIDAESDNSRNTLNEGASVVSKDEPGVHTDESCTAEDNSSVLKRETVGSKEGANTRKDESDASKDESSTPKDKLDVSNDEFYDSTVEEPKGESSSNFSTSEDKPKDEGSQHEEECISLDAKTIAFITQTQVNDLHRHHPNIKFTIHPGDNLIIVTGKGQDRENFKQSLNKVKFHSAKIDVCTEALDYLSSSDYQSIINRLLQKQMERFGVYYDHTTDQIYILASKNLAALKLASNIEQTIHYSAIKNSRNLFKEHDFASLCKQFKEEYNVDVTILPSEIEIIGDKQHVIKVEMILRKHIQQRYLKNKKIEVSNGCWRFISEHLTKQWSKIMDKTNPDCIDTMISLPDSTDSKHEILLEGEESFIAIMSEEINALIACIFTSDPPLILDQPGIFEFLSTQEIRFTLKGIESALTSCIEIAIKSPGSDEGSDSTREICKGTTKEGKRVILVEGNIEVFRVDVIVNPANKRLKYTSGIALALSKRGGPKIQKDSDNYIRACGGELLDGDVVMRDEVGDLSCKKIIHAVGPLWRDDEVAEKILAKTCTKSLKLANKHRSIAFPPIPARTFKFPVAVSASTMIQAFCTWSEEFPNVPLHDIFVVVHSHAIEAFRSAIKEFLITPLGSTSSTAETTDITESPWHVETKACKSSLTALHTSCTMKGALQIQLYRGELLQQQVS